jgi:dynactin-4
MHPSLQGLTQPTIERCVCHQTKRCARNCFLCPICTNTLSVVPSDPSEPPEGARSPVTISAVGEPPFFLYCNHCRWDSVDAGITFEKPTGLALQLQKTEDSAPEILELEKLKDYFEPALRQAQAQQQFRASTQAHLNLNPIQAAASSALSRDIPSFKYSSSRRPGMSSSNSRRGVPPALPSPGAQHHDIDDPATEYKPRIWMSAGGGIGHDAEVEWLANLGFQGEDEYHTSRPTTPTSHSGEVATLAQRLHATQFSWAPTHSLRTVDLKPTRVPLRSKKSKRCPKCTHILIKPELKAQSTKWKIKLVAGNYLPGVEVGHADPLSQQPAY